jgi:hypothetical protein
MLRSPDPERDHAIAADLKAGIGLTALSVKYGMSKGMIIGIGKRVDRRRWIEEKVAADPHDINNLAEYLGIRNGRIISRLKSLHGVTRIEQLAGYTRSQLPVSVGMDQLIEYAKGLGVHLKFEDRTEADEEAKARRRTWAWR